MGMIEGFEPFVGQHCETTATGNLLKQAGLELSEPMLFGLGEGLAFGVFASRSMPAPFIGGRSKGEEVTKKLAQHLDLGLEYRQTRSRPKAWANVAAFIDSGVPVAAKLDMHFLDYFEDDIHFAAHYVAVHGYDDEHVFVVDTDAGSNRTRRSTFEEGRLWRGPMASNALTWTLTVPDTDPDWPSVLTAAITANARDYLNPPISNLGARGIRKAARLVPTWLDAVDDAPAAMAGIGYLMEYGGTGGGLFRRMYARFLEQANEYLDSPVLDEARAGFDQAAPLWTQVAERLGAVDEDGRTALEDASALMARIADIEESAVASLASLRS